MKSVRVSLKERSYNIGFGPLEKGFLPALKSVSSPTKILVLTSRAVANGGHLNRLKKQLARMRASITSIVLPNGEQHKTLKTVQSLYTAGFKAGLDRKSLVIGLGGGVITDMAGYFAATYMRGIPFVSVPTTVLGMVDAAIGGKTGVDTPEGKNLVGAFWQPKLVWIDAAFLKTLPEREWRTGMAEIVKYGVIKDAKFFTWLESKIRHSDFSKWPSNDVMKALHRSAEVKAMVVSGDERETPLKGGREILNFGHTSGHALEAAVGFGGLSHGEAISIGMVLAGHLALSLGLWSSDAQLQMISFFEAAKLPTRFPKLSSKEKAAFWSALHKDKKNIGGHLRFVLPERLGKVQVRSGISVSLVKAAAKRCGYR